MGASFFVVGASASTLAVTLQQMDVNGQPADLWWRQTGTPGWYSAATVPLESDRRISLSNTGSAVGFWWAYVAALGTYTGNAIVYIWDTTSGLLHGAYAVRVSGGHIAFPHQQAAVLAEEWTNGGRLDNLLDTAAAGGSVTTISPAVVDDSRTWTLTRYADAVTAKNRVTVGLGAIPTIAFDFRNVLNGPETSLVSVVEIVDVGSALTIGSVAVSQGRKAAHGTITAGMAAGTKYRLRCKITTTDSQTLVAYGDLMVV